VSPARFLRDLVVVLALAAGAVLGTTRWLAVPWSVEGPSMEPTLREGDRVIVDLLSFRRRAPREGDVVLLDGPGGIELVKRVAGDETTAPIPPPLLEPDSALEPAFIVLGDNLTASSDSRAFGPVPLHRIRGRIVWRYWPVERFGPIR
jgi:signal peptidase I